MANSIRGLVGDVITLGELQVRLLQADLRDGRSQLTQGIILLAISVTLLLASLPVALIALSYGIVEVYQLPMWAGFLISAAVGFVIGGILLWAGSRWLATSLAFFQRSGEEFSNNLKWLKHTSDPDTGRKTVDRN